MDCLKRRFPASWKDGVPDDDLPLFPSEDGEVVAKDRMALAIMEAAQRLGSPLETPDGSSKVTGHSLRVSGAQGLARAGMDVWAIQLLGRWGSSVVLDYVREVPLEAASTWASRVARSDTIDVVKDSSIKLHRYTGLELLRRRAVQKVRPV